MSVPTPEAPRFTPVADHALLVEFAEALSSPAHDAVLALDLALAGNAIAGMRETVPAYVSLLVEFDPLVTDHRLLETAVRHCLTQPRGAGLAGQTRQVQVCYDADLSPDMAEVCRQTGLSSKAVIAAHLAGDYRSVCMVSRRAMPIWRACRRLFSCRANPRQCAMCLPEAS